MLGVSATRFSSGLLFFHGLTKAVGKGNISYTAIPAVLKMSQLIDVLISRSMKQGIDPAALDTSKEPYQSGKVVKMEVPVRNGLKQEDAKKIVKLIKDSGLKVQAQIMDDLVRVTAKKIDDLQQVIQVCKTSNLDLPMQYINMRS